MSTIDLAVPYHLQDQIDDCGPACAQMMLDFLGAGLIDQAPLYVLCHSKSPANSNWKTYPDGLAYALNTEQPVSQWGLRNNFIVNAADTVAQGSQAIVSSLYGWGQPVAALVEGCKHWIVVCGVQTDVDPTQGDPWTIQGFYVNYPVPEPNSPPPPHHDPDLCGTGRAWGVPNFLVSYNSSMFSWAGFYFTGCSDYTASYPQFISVSNKPELVFRPPVILEPKPRKIGPPLTREQAVAIGLDGLRTNVDPASHLAALTAAQPGAPVLVRWLELSEAFYFLIPMMQGQECAGMLMIDAVSGDLAGAYRLPRAGPSPIISQDDAVQRVLREPIDLGPSRGRVRLRDGAYGVDPTMVWRRCRESYLPYSPFYRFTVDDGQIYVGSDGAIYPVLHDLG